MAKYIELIDKYRIVQSKDTDYNPPSYEWVDNTGEIVRCEDCKYAKRNDKHPDKPLICYLTRRVGEVKDDWFCADGERRSE